MEDLSVRQSHADAGTEVVGVAKRRTFSAAYKRRILDEVDRARPGEIGLILRREGIILLAAGKLAEMEQWRGVEKEDRQRCGRHGDVQAS